MFTKEKINEYADKLLIGLTDEECTMIQSEFDLVSKNMDLINEIDDIKSTEILSFPFDMEIDDLYDGKDTIDEIEPKDLLRNCDKYEGREVVVPKVV